MPYTESVDEIICAAFAIIRSKLTGVTGRECGMQFSISRQEVFWIGLQAFQMVLSRKRAMYIQTLQHIQEEIDAMRSNIKRPRLLTEAIKRVKDSRLIEKLHY